MKNIFIPLIIAILGVIVTTFFIVEKAQSLEGTTWVQEEGLAELKFSEDNNTCYLNLKTDIEITLFLNYYKVDEELMFETKDGLSSFMTLLTTQSSNLKGELRPDRTIVIWIDEENDKGILFHKK